jgi:hypothetical protein
MLAGGRILPLLSVILLLAGCGTWDTAADGALRDGDESLGRRKLREALGHFRQAGRRRPAAATPAGVSSPVLGERTRPWTPTTGARRRPGAALPGGVLAAHMGRRTAACSVGASAAMKRDWQALLPSGARAGRAPARTCSPAPGSCPSPAMAVRLLGGLENVWPARGSTARSPPGSSPCTWTGQRDAALDLAPARAGSPGADTAGPAMRAGRRRTLSRCSSTRARRLPARDRDGVDLRGLAGSGARRSSTAPALGGPGVRQRAATFLRACRRDGEAHETLNRSATTSRHVAPSAGGRAYRPGSRPRAIWPYRNIGLVCERQKDAGRRWSGSGRQWP